MSDFQDGAADVHGRVTPELIARVRALRRRAFAPAATKATEESSLQQQVNDLQAQVAHLEQLVQGFQDSVYRDTHRQDERIAELLERTAPAALAAALSKDARDRGL